MARFHRFYNITGASKAYIERIVPSYEEDEEELYPVPASKENYDKPALTP
jgi:surfeit locus 1 family protein